LEKYIHVVCVAQWNVIDWQLYRINEELVYDVQMCTKQERLKTALLRLKFCQFEYMTFGMAGLVF